MPRALPSVIRSTAMKQPLTTSNVSILLWATGWIAVAVGVLSAVAALHDTGNAAISDVAVAIGGLSSGFVFIGLGSIVDRLSKIEHHLRPEESDKPVKANSDYAPPIRQEESDKPVKANSGYAPPIRPKERDRPVKANSDCAPPNKLTCDWCGEAVASNSYLLSVEGRGFLCERCRTSLEPVG